MADFVLRVLEGTTPGTELPIEDELLLGRSAGPSGNLGGDATLSRRHARIQRTPEGLLLEDLGSHNGTLLNGTAIVAPVVLAAGDRIEVGETTLELIGVAPPAPDPPPPPAEPDPARTRVSHRIVAPPPAPDPQPPPAPVPPAATDQPTRLGEVPVVPVGAGDQPTRLGEVPVVPVGAGEQPTRLGEVPVPAGSATQPDAGSPVPAAEPPAADEAPETGRAPWWRRLLRGSR
jgi:predicted component of type VI protein secretion system